MSIALFGAYRLLNPLNNVVRSFMPAQALQSARAVFCAVCTVCFCLFIQVSRPPRPGRQPPYQWQVATCHYPSQSIPTCCVVGHAKKKHDVTTKPPGRDHFPVC